LDALFIGRLLIFLLDTCRLEESLGGGDARSVATGDAEDSFLGSESRLGAKGDVVEADTLLVTVRMEANGELVAAAEDWGKSSTDLALLAGDEPSSSFSSRNRASSADLRLICSFL